MYNFLQKGYNKKMKFLSCQDISDKLRKIGVELKRGAVLRRIKERNLLTLRAEMLKMAMIKIFKKENKKKC